jgi:site-specific DNA-methyltransferase (adenine-specific)
MHHGEALQWLQSLPSDYADAIVCDPPYSSGGATRGDRMGSTTQKYVGGEVQLERPDFHGDNRDQRGYLAWCGVWMFEAMRVTQPGGLLAVFTDWRQLPITTDAVQVAGWVWRGIAVWDKTESARPNPGRYRSQAEFVVWSSKGPMTGSEPGSTAPGVFRHRRAEEDRQHITGKPVPLMEGLLAIVRKGGLVLDPFAGSGSTGVACLRTGRRFAGCELGDQQHALAVSRLTAEEQDRPWLAPPEQAGLFGGGGAA